jgi:hypothetical protein
MRRIKPPKLHVPLRKLRCGLQMIGAEDREIPETRMIMEVATTGIGEKTMTIRERTMTTIGMIGTTTATREVRIGAQAIPKTPLGNATWLSLELDHLCKLSPAQGDGFLIGFWPLDHDFDDLLTKMTFARERGAQPAQLGTIFKQRV